MLRALRVKPSLAYSLHQYYTAQAGLFPCGVCASAWHGCLGENPDMNEKATLRGITDEQVRCIMDMAAGASDTEGFLKLLESKQSKAILRM